MIAEIRFLTSTVKAIPGGEVDQVVPDLHVRAVEREASRIDEFRLSLLRMAEHTNVERAIAEGLAE